MQRPKGVALNGFVKASVAVVVDQIVMERETHAHVALVFLEAAIRTIESILTEHAMNVRFFVAHNTQGHPQDQQS